MIIKEYNQLIQWKHTDIEWVKREIKRINIIRKYKNG